jgi:phage/plasmid-like protein (TIGR03299 family)
MDRTPPLPISIVGSRYRVIQNTELFQVFDPLIEQGLLTYETCGVLDEGRIVWVLAKFGKDTQVRGEEVAGYFLLSSGHDGKNPLKATLTPVRVVCWNTLNNAEKCESEFKVKHVSTYKRRIEQGMEMLEIGIDKMDELTDAFGRLANEGLDLAQAEGLFEQLVPDNPTAKKNTRTENIRTELAALFRTGRGNQGNSFWDWYNAVTEYADHRMSSRGGENGKLRSMFSTGSANKIKRRALALALEQIEEA